jgi:hypothetical protein
LRLGLRYSVLTSYPATCLGELTENFDELHKLRTKDYYERHRPAQAQ